MSSTRTSSLLDLAKELAKKPVSKESSLKSLKSAGILDKNGRVTNAYPHLRKFLSSK